MRRPLALATLAFVITASAADVLDPPLALWRVIRKSLSENERFFDENAKDALIPGGANHVRALRGTVASIGWELHRAFIRVSMEPHSDAEVTLEVPATVPLNGIEAGKTVVFQGVARKFARNPFMLTFEVDGNETFVELEKTAPK